MSTYQEFGEGGGKESLTNVHMSELTARGAMVYGSMM